MEEKVLQKGRGECYDIFIEIYPVVKATGNKRFLGRRKTEREIVMKQKRNQSTMVNFLGFGTMILAFVFVASVILVTLANGHLNDAYENLYDLTMDAEKLGTASKYLTQEARAYVSTGETQHKDNYFREVNTDKNREAAVYAAEEIGMSAEEEKLITDIFALSGELAVLEENAFALAEAGDNEAGTAILYGDEYEAGIAQVTAMVNEFEESVIARQQHSVDAQANFIGIMNVIAYVAAAIAVTALTTLIFYVKRDMVVPVVKLSESMVALAGGDLNNDLGMEPDTSEIGRTVDVMLQLQKFQKDVIGDMAYLLGEMANGNFDIRTRIGDAAYAGDYKELLMSIREMNRTLSETLSNINVAVEQVDMGSNQVADGSQALAQGTTEQASAIQQLSAALVELTNHVQQNAENAREGSGMSAEAGQGVNESNKDMQKLMQAMGEIETSANEINKIIKTIDDIAFQTNILALNAAVEAARAGAAGKGFAVVADEVRNLAAKSAEAAKNTTELIESTVHAVNNGTRIANETAQALDNVVQKASVVNVKIQEIASVCEEQANAIQEINVGIDQISSVVQTNSATAEESAAASEELSSQANMVKDLVGQFRLRADGGMAAAFSSKPAHSGASYTFDAAGDKY